MGTEPGVERTKYRIMDKRRIIEALNIIQTELNSEELDTDMVIYQIYCEANRFIAEEIKRIIKEEGVVTREHPQIDPLYKLLDRLMVPMRRYSQTVRKSEEDSLKNIKDII